MIFIELKPEWFTYKGKKYERKRYVSDDMKLFVTIDQLNGAMSFMANANGNPSQVRVAQKLQPDGCFPRYETLQEIKEQLEFIDREKYPYTLNIHETQFKNNSKPKFT